MWRRTNCGTLKAAQTFHLKTLVFVLLDQDHQRIMMSIKRRTGSLTLLNFLLGEQQHEFLSVGWTTCLTACLSAGVFLVCPGVLSLELLPSSSKVLLTSNANFTVVGKHLRSPQVPLYFHRCAQLAVCLLSCALAGVRWHGCYLRTLW